MDLEELNLKLKMNDILALVITSAESGEGITKYHLNSSLMRTDRMILIKKNGIFYLDMALEETEIKTIEILNLYSYAIGRINNDMEKLKEIL